MRHCILYVSLHVLLLVFCNNVERDFYQSLIWSCYLRNSLEQAGLAVKVLYIHTMPRMHKCVCGV